MDASVPNILLLEVMSSKKGCIQNYGTVAHAFFDKKLSIAVHLCNIYGDHETHEALNMCPEGDHSFCMFSLKFSADNSEILGG